MLSSMLHKLRDPKTLRHQLDLERAFMFTLFPVNLLGSDIVPRALRFAGYRAFGMKVRTPNIFGGMVLSGSPEMITIEEGASLNRGVFFESVGPVTIGRDTQVGMQTMFVTSHHDRLPDGTISKEPQPRAIRIGERCWIGARAIFLPGVTVADDVCVASGSVVTRDCSVAGATYAGVPARMIAPPSETYLATHPDDRATEPRAESREAADDAATTSTS